VNKKVLKPVEADKSLYSVDGETFVKIQTDFKKTLESGELDAMQANVEHVVSRCEALIERHTPKVTVYKLQLDGFNGPIVFTDLDLVIKETEALLAEPDSETKVIVTKAEMTPEEIENLPEFEGY